MKDYLNYTKMDLYIHLRPNYMARYSGPIVELTCLCHVPRFDPRVLSFKRSGPIQLSYSFLCFLLYIFFILTSIPIEIVAMLKTKRLGLPLYKKFKKYSNRYKSYHMWKFLFKKIIVG